jgi:hypothetical protein
MKTRRVLPLLVLHKPLMLSPSSVTTHKSLSSTAHLPAA